MIRISNVKVSIETNLSKLEDKIKRKYNLPNILSFKIIKKSIDAREKHNIIFVYIFDIKIENEQEFLNRNKYKNIVKIENEHYVAPKLEVETYERPIVIGSGPSGLFACITLVEAGLKPILIEKGMPVEKRMEDIDKFINTGVLNTKSNIQFGEGGAGTFSDGKLTTGIKDKRIEKVNNDFIKFGANPDIESSNKPHIGTDVLVDILKNIRKYLLDNGATIMFETTVTDIIVKDSNVIGVKLENNEEMFSNQIVLACGHSAKDIFYLLDKHNVKMKKKNFSMGVRIEHKQSWIDKSQYGKYYNHHALVPTSYKLVHHSSNGHSAYTFCVCPGGYVVPATSEVDHVVTNGMSKHARDGENINGAILVSISPDDLDDDLFSGIKLQEELERKAFIVGGSNYFAPVQLVKDFLDDVPSSKLGNVKPTYTPGITLTSLDLVLPKFMIDTIKEALLSFDKKIRGFANDDALLTAIESRSTSPIRIIRDDNLQSVSISGLYPTGEGAGYAGGIMSSAVDGIKVAEQIINYYNKKRSK